MSADNGIYILETPAIDESGHAFGTKYEYRVCELMAIENLYYDKNAPEAVPPSGREYHMLSEYRPDDKEHCDYQKAYRIKYHSDNPDVLIRNARNMWRGCKVFTDKSSALMCAAEIEASNSNNGYPLEYGIQFIRIARVF